MTSPVCISALAQPKYHCAQIKPNQPLLHGVLRRSFHLSFSLPFLSLNPLSATSSDSISTSHEADQVAYDFSPVMKVHRDGRIERLAGLKTVPPGIDSITGVESKDVVISEDGAVSARIYLPKITSPDLKLPVLAYFHGGDFCIESAFSPSFHNILNSVTYQANVIGVSVNYRNAPEHPLPTCHEDSWTAVKWITSHFGGNGPDEWLNRHTDLGEVTFAGDSSGANIAHHMAIRVGLEKPLGLTLDALVLVHPFFWGEERTESERNQPAYTAKLDRLWKFLCPSESGGDDPLINPEKDPNVGRLGCKRLLICVAEEDLMRDRALNYKNLLENNGFSGELNVFESKGENHSFHIFKPTCENSLALISRIASFIKQD